MFYVCFQPYERMNIADALFSKTYEADDVIIKQVGSSIGIDAGYGGL